MARYGWTRRLLVLLVAVSLSSGWGLRLPSRAAAIAWPRPGAGAAALPAGLAAALRRGRLGADAAPAPVDLGASGVLTWTQQGELTSTAEVPNDGYGQAVALSGATAVVGASGPWPTFDGAAYVFARIGNTWTQQIELTNPGGL